MGVPLRHRAAYRQLRGGFLHAARTGLPLLMQEAPS